MAAKGAREPITLECTECKRRTYMTEKNKKNNIIKRYFGQFYNILIYEDIGIFNYIFSLPLLKKM